MIIVLGLLILVAALVVGVAGVLTNAGPGHALGHGFAVLGYHVTGSTGTLFLYGVVVGAVAIFGLSLVLTAARRTSRRAHNARGELRQSRQATDAVLGDRDNLISQRDTARADTSPALGSNGSGGARRRTPAKAARRHLFGLRPHDQHSHDQQIAPAHAADDRLGSTALEPTSEQADADRAGEPAGTRT